MKREERRGTQPDLDILKRKEATLINKIYLRRLNSDLIEFDIES